jgi:hypothetical protein
MLAKLNQPLWPQSRFSLTTPLSLILTGLSVVVGVTLYLRGYTYEGATLAYMVGGILFAWPYYSARFTWCMTFLVMSCFIPISIYAQNKAVESGSWYYRPPEGYLLWITKAGEGWGYWTRHLWLGNDMPAMEYFFYPLFCLFHVTLFSLFSHLLPDHWLEQKHPRLRWVFPIVFGLALVAFGAIYFIFPNHNCTDYLYWLAAVGYVITLIAYAISPNYRAYTQSPAFWIWAVGMGGMFMPCWEFFHCCLNRDWIYDRANTFPFFVTYRGVGIPLSELLGYLTTATTFQGLMLMFIRKFGKVVIKNYSLVPFSRTS